MRKLVYLVTLLFLRHQGDQIGRVLAYWAVVYFGCFLFTVVVAQIHGLLFSQCFSSALILTKTGWATFWATFSQTHLVTLLFCVTLSTSRANSFSST
jgi:hypothetical protein